MWVALRNFKKKPFEGETYYCDKQLITDILNKGTYFGNTMQEVIDHVAPLLHVSPRRIQIQCL